MLLVGRLNGYNLRCGLLSELLCVKLAAPMVKEGRTCGREVVCAVFVQFLLEQQQFLLLHALLGGFGPGVKVQVLPVSSIVDGVAITTHVKRRGGPVF